LRTLPLKSSRIPKLFFYSHGWKTLEHTFLLLVTNNEGNVRYQEHCCFYSNFKVNNELPTPR
jgi:hypothetical protein